MFRVGPIKTNNSGGRSQPRVDYKGTTSRRAVVALAVILVNLKTYADSLEQ